MKIYHFRNQKFKHMYRFISFSGGVESRAMCVLYGDKADAAIFSDTGFEHAQLYSELDRFEVELKKIHPELPIIRIRNEKYPEGLPQYIRESKYYPSFRQRFCTRMFKIEPIDNFLRQFKDEGVEIMIGLNAEEGNQRTGNHGLLPFVNYSYPLFDQGVTRAMCKGILKALNVEPNFPPYMRRGGCKGCYYKAKKEFICMMHMAPEEYAEVVELEEAIQDERDDFFAIRDCIPDGLRKFQQDITSQGLLFDVNDVYGVVNDATSCGVFCNR